MRAAVAVALCAACSGSARPPTGPVARGADAAPVVDREAEQVAAIEHAMNEYGPAIFTCWSMGAADDFHLAGKVVVAVVLGADGKAADVRVDEDEPRDPVLDQCLTDLWHDAEWPKVFSPGDTVRLPFSFVAPDAQYVVASAHVPELPLTGSSSTVQVLLDERNTGNQAAALSLLRLRDGYQLPLHRHSSTEVVYVLAGEADVLDLGGAGKGQHVAAGSAIYVAAGVAHGFVQTGAEPTVLLVLDAPAGPEQRWKGGQPVGTTPVADKELGHPPRRFPRPRVRLTTDAAELASPGGTVRIVFDKDSAGEGSVALDAVTRTAAVPSHNHAGSSEYLFVLEGAGTMTVAGNAYPIAAGDAIQIPPTVEHAVALDDGATLKAIQFYTPSGPEQRFKAPAK